MGAYSTMHITRKDAIKEILASLMDASDSQIADVLFDLVGEKHLRNFRIVPDYDASDDSMYVYREGVFR